MLPVLETLEAPSTAYLLLSNVDAAARHTDYTCNAEFSEFVATSVVPWAKGRFLLSAQTITPPAVSVWWARRRPSGAPVSRPISKDPEPIGLLLVERREVCP